MQVFLASLVCVIHACTHTVVTGNVISSIPLLPWRTGVTYGNGTPTASVRVDAYLDSLCPDSLAAWPTLRAMAAHYRADQVQLVVHLQALPYHRNSFMAMQGYFMLLDKLGKEAAFEYLGATLENSNKLSSLNTVNITPSQVLGKLADLASEMTSVDKQDFIKLHNNYYERADMTWKYNVQRGVSGTPWYFVNDVLVESESSWTLEAWTKLLDSLLKENHN